MDDEGAVLRLIDEPRWNDSPITSARVVSLLALLAGARGRTVSEALLIDRLWPQHRPTNAGKAVHVVVSRARQASAAGLVVRTAEGYRLDPGAARVDAVTALTDAERAAAAWRSGRLEETIAAARAALAPSTTPDLDRAATDPLGELRAQVADAQQHARALLGMALSSIGEHEEAYPLLRQAAAAEGHRADEPLLEHLLRSELATRGAAAALARYETYRRTGQEQLGTDPGPALRRLHAELLAADRPERSGVRTGPQLIGRDDDTRVVLGLLERHRVVTLLGTGGLGKTSLAHAVAARSQRTAVHVVELVGARTGDDVLIEVAGALGADEGLRDRRDARRWQDVRGRCAERLARLPSLLVLDNCEHVIDAVADLVAFLVAAAGDLQVLTTSRTPVAIAAEHVYPVAQLDAEDAAELFRQRARAARPQARLPETTVRAIVSRLDGLPLAIELAAAKIRALSAAEIAVRLDDRFTLLRSRDRTAPARHRTLADLIEWSWMLLDDRAQRGMAWLALLPDGFVLSTAGAVLPAADSRGGPLAVVEALVEQSLLVVREDADGVRYRMLETLREFALLRLADSGERAAANAAVQSWAVALSGRLFTDLGGSEQVAAMNTVTDEEAALVVVAREALGQARAEVAIPVLATLTRYWTLSGQFARLAGPLLDDAVGLCPASAPGSRDMARVIVAAALLTHGIFGKDVRAAREALAALGPEVDDPAIAAETGFALRIVTPTGEVDTDLLRQESASPDLHRARLAWQWVAHWLENEGDVTGAVQAVQHALALTDPAELPVSSANLESSAAMLHLQLGDFAAGERHADRALVTVRLLHAHAESTELATLRALALIDAGRLDEAEAAVAALEDQPGSGGGPHAVPGAPRAELCLARGQWTEGLRRYREHLRRVAATTAPAAVGTARFEPWTLYASAVCLTAHARFGGQLADPDSRAEAEQLADSLLATTASYLAHRTGFIDYPIAGSLLFALGWWHGSNRPEAADPVARLLVLADTFGYNRGRPTMSWLPAATMTPEVSSAVERWQQRYRGRFGPALRDEAEAALLELHPADRTARHQSERW